MRKPTEHHKYWKKWYTKTFIRLITTCINFGLNAKPINIAFSLSFACFLFCFVFLWFLAFISTAYPLSLLLFFACKYIFLRRPPQKLKLLNLIFMKYFVTLIGPGREQIKPWNNTKILQKIHNLSHFKIQP